MLKISLGAGLIYCTLSSTLLYINIPKIQLEGLHILLRTQGVEVSSNM